MLTSASSRISRAIAITLLGCTFWASANAMAQQAPLPMPRVKASSSPDLTTATYGDWVLRCVRSTTRETQKMEKQQSPGKQCEIIQTIQLQGQRQPIAQLAIGYRPGESILTITAVLPVNISLPGSVQITDKQGHDMNVLNWTRCLQGACFANANASHTILKKLSGQQQGFLQFHNANGQKTAIPLSWRGLIQAVDALEKAR